MIQLHRTPSLLKKLYPSLIWSIETKKSELFLTFDDGPHPEITPWVLEQLNEYDGHATFFCVGDNLRRFKSVGEQVIADGSKLANHTYNHLKGWQTSNSTYGDNVLACEHEIDSISDSHNKLFRPPYGRIKASQIRMLKPSYQIVMWSHLSWDFDKHLHIKKSLEALKTVERGSIVVFHDSEKAFKNLKQLLPEVLDYWSGQGFTFSAL